jgi:hypothetical protein
VFSVVTTEGLSLEEIATILVVLVVDNKSFVTDSEVKNLILLECLCIMGQICHQEHYLAPSLGQVPRNLSISRLVLDNNLTDIKSTTRNSRNCPTVSSLNALSVVLSLNVIGDTPVDVKLSAHPSCRKKIK